MVFVADPENTANSIECCSILSVWIDDDYSRAGIGSRAQGFEQTSNCIGLAAAGRTQDCSVTGDKPLQID